jgi:predicted esterase
MEIKKIPAMLVIILFFLFPAHGSDLEDATAVQIFQTSKEIVIDGSLDEWSDFDEIPIQFTSLGMQAAETPDLTVTAKFTFDSENIYIAVKVLDDIFEFPNRSWRYGDGFYLTFFDPYQGRMSDRFHSFGFSLQGKAKTKVLVNRDGTYFLSSLSPNVQFEVLPDPQNRIVIYEISIPFKQIIPFKPFIHKKWGINLIYVDRDLGTRNVVQLYPDSQYDTELFNKRKGEIFEFKSHAPIKTEFQSLMNTTRFYDDTEKIITVAVNSPSQDSGWKLRYDLSSRSGHESSSQDIDLKQGMNLFKFKLQSEKFFTGIYDISLGVLDSAGALKYSEDIQFFVINRSEYEEFRSKLVKAGKSKVFSSDEKFRRSLPSLEIRFQWIDRFMNSSPPYAEAKELELWHEQLDYLIHKMEEEKPPLFEKGQPARLAHRSKIDNTLQPYSLFVPPDYDGETPLPLFVTLHGSGVDEKRTLISTVNAHYSQRRRIKNSQSFIILAPKARGLSDWYTGYSGEDVIECIEHVKSLYKIDKERIILDGFSMGGYGAWRLSHLYPDLFKAIIIRSGAIEAPSYLKGEKIVDMLNRSKKLNFFIVHGGKDNAVPVENAREIVAKLKKLRIKYKYIEVKKAAHGGYNKWPEIFKWLDQVMR